VSVALHSISRNRVPDSVATRSVRYSSTPEFGIWSYTASNLLTPLLTYCCKLFVVAKNFNSFAIKQIRTLSIKCWGMASASLPGGRPARGLPRKARLTESATYKLSSSSCLQNGHSLVPLSCTQAVHESPITDHESRLCPPATSLSALCFHTLTNCFSRKSFRFTFMRIAPGVASLRLAVTVKAPAALLCREAGILLQACDLCLIRPALR
jgi:hypothetical protein